MHTAPNIEIPGNTKHIFEYTGDRGWLCILSLKFLSWETILVCKVESTFKVKLI